MDVRHRKGVRFSWIDHELHVWLVFGRRLASRSGRPVVLVADHHKRGNAGIHFIVAVGKMRNDSGDGHIQIAFDEGHLVDSEQRRIRSEAVTLKEDVIRVDFGRCLVAATRRIWPKRPA